MILLIELLMPLIIPVYVIKTILMMMGYHQYVKIVLKSVNLV